MATADAKAANDPKKLILAIGLGLLAVITIWWAFFGFGGSKPPTRVASGPLAPSPSPTPTNRRPQEQQTIDTEDIGPIHVPAGREGVPDEKRNIFAYYVKPVPTPKPSFPPSPTPTPTPPVLLAALSPSNVYAGTEDFRLDLSGDKFSPALHVMIDTRRMPTTYINPQQMAITVPASMIATPGRRQVLVKSDDGASYSLPLTLSIADPPKPTGTFIGFIAKPRHIGDTALILNKSTKEVQSAQRGDIVEGRFRVSSISAKEVVLVDTQLKIKHPLPLMLEGEKGGSYPQGRPTPKVATEDDEP
jgi:hypothetical protein